MAILALVLTPRVSEAHPLHTTFVELAFTPATGVVTATVKVFADDFLKRASRGSNQGLSNEAMLQKQSRDYLAQTLRLAPPTGPVLQWRFCGWKRSADLIFICLSAGAKGGLTGLRISDSILSDVFPDQVNIVQAESAGSRHTLLFTGGAGEKRLP